MMTGTMHVGADKLIVLNEDTAHNFATTADATQDNTDIGTGGDAPQHGTAVVNDNGSITYTPNGNYSGRDSFTYTTTGSGGDTQKVTVSVAVMPKSDAPVFVFDSDISTSEDQAVLLNLNLPTITDGNDGDGDNPERLGPISLTVPDGVQLLNGGGDVLTDVSGVITMSEADYQALKVNPVPQSHENFNVTVSMTEYEVDDGGNQLSGVSGMTTTVNIPVDVKAVTDPVDLQWDTAAVGNINSQDNVHSAAIDTTEGKLTVMLDEDSSVNLKNLLGSTFNDTDGSEHRWVEITGLPTGAKVGTQTVGADGKITLEMSDGATSLPDMDITPPKDFSGDMSTFTVTLYGQDRDSDSDGGTSDSPHLATQLSDSVTVDFQVRPVGGDVTATEVSTKEDTSTTFLDAISVTDTGTDGSEKITGIVIKDLPDGWVIKDTTGTAIFTGDGSTEYTVPSNAVEDESYKNYTVTPPAHSSKDLDMQVTVTTEDTQTVGGSSVSVSTGKLPIPVTPMVTERQTSL